ncbi:hypothetical protein D3P09_12435 [Paenibacillus pinisoli]|uniref:DoxX family membrane protein n=1 Tax=Paenibacillus pinisoli TaxID=1276110 RepID=A0A3A6Q2G1_9BACL|nr:hypothetical protein [Paenibacillus pinisoli]RJX40164.1 hypothetical protein D3P09_12435 [Paenibacillus pinisoli]
MFPASPAYVPVLLHVKWFIRDHDWTPQDLVRVITPTFLFWLGFTLFVLLIVSLSTPYINRHPWSLAVDRFMNRLKPHMLTVLRIGLGIGLIMQLATGTYLAPTLVSNDPGVYVILTIAILGLIHKRTLVISGAAILTLYIIVSRQYGLFHALDYMFYLGIIYTLFVANTRLHHTYPIVLYLFSGVSLAWLAMEKFTLAKLACSLMHEYGIPSLGFTVEDFVLISAFIELGLAWAFIAGLLNRFSALMLTGLFLMTTTIFGVTEIIGHAVVHTLLVVFIIGGRDASTTLHRLMPNAIMRHTSVLVSFTLLLFGLMSIYIWMGQPNGWFA